MWMDSWDPLSTIRTLPITRLSILRTNCLYRVAIMVRSHPESNSTDRQCPYGSHKLCDVAARGTSALPIVLAAGLDF